MSIVAQTVRFCGFSFLFAKLVLQKQVDYEQAYFLTEAQVLVEAYF